MRIIAGKYGGQIISDVHGNKTHPMSEKIRGALFNALGDIDDLVFLDAYAGTGAVGIEALSRGAKHVTAIDISKEAGRTIQKNIVKLHLERYLAHYEMNITTWSENNSNLVFDVVVLDPPYDEVKPDVLIRLSAHVKLNGLLVLSLPAAIDFDEPSDFEQLVKKEYGDARLEFYRRIR